MIFCVISDFKNHGDIRFKIAENMLYRLYTIFFESTVL